MAHIWIQDNTGEWVAMTLNNDVMTLTKNGVYPDSIGQEEKTEQGSVFIKSWQHAEETIWLVMAGRGARVWVNGRPLQTGIGVLQDRDEVRIRQKPSVFFSTEELAEVLPFQAGNSPASLEQVKPCACMHSIRQIVMPNQKLETHRIEQTLFCLIKEKNMKTWNFQNGNHPLGENGQGNLPRKDQFEGLGAKRVVKVDSRLYVIHFRHILYAFKGSAAAKGMVKIQKFPPDVFSPDRIYLRTSKSVFLTSHRSFEALRKTLDSSSFEQSHQNFLVNLQRVGWLETRDKTGRLAIIPDDGIPEEIPVTRQYKPKILTAFHLPQRRRPKKNETDKQANSNGRSCVGKKLVRLPNNIISRNPIPC